eukprot:COSAG01_NODE_4407_length_5056_cov_4.859794_9_plen_207_part_01
MNLSQNFVSQRAAACKHNLEPTASLRPGAVAYRGAVAGERRARRIIKAAVGCAAGRSAPLPPPAQQPLHFAIAGESLLSQPPLEAAADRQRHAPPLFMAAGGGSGPGAQSAPAPSPGSADSQSLGPPIVNLEDGGGAAMHAVGGAGDPGMRQRLVRAHAAEQRRRRAGAATTASESEGLAAAAAAAGETPSGNSSRQLPRPLSPLSL